MSKSPHKRRFGIVLRGCVFWLLALATVNVLAAEARLEVLTLESRALRDNPLHDPDLRRIAVFLPAQATSGARLPVVYYLPGYGGSTDGFIRNPKEWTKSTQKIADTITPMVFAVVDGKTRWGGSQYLNSPAQGNYADYVCDEVVETVESRHPAATKGIRRIIAGHSSGGFVRCDWAWHDKNCSMACWR